jgi:hypothetical protein
MRQVLTFLAMALCMASFLCGTALLFIGGLALQSFPAVLIGSPLFLVGLGGFLVFEIWS